MMENDKWVKTFIAPNTQVNVTAIPHGKGFVKVQAAVMVGGKMHEKLLYDGDAPNKAQDAFDQFMRPQAIAFVNSVEGKTEKQVQLEKHLRSTAVNEKTGPIEEERAVRPAPTREEIDKTIGLEGKTGAIGIEDHAGEEGIEEHVLGTESKEEE